MIPNYDAIIKKAKSLCDDKNTDYAQTEEPFSNFEMVEALKICDTSTGILVRISDKIARISNLLKRNYSVILLSYYMYEQEYKMYTDSENGEKNDTSR